MEDLPLSVRRTAEFLGRPTADKLRRRVERGGQETSILYNSEGLEYNRSFFIKNSIKCSVIAQNFLKTSTQIGSGVIVDIGGGIGTFSLCVLPRRPTYNYVIVDRSPMQIRHGCKIFDRLGHSDKVHFMAANAPPPAWSNDPVALFSYSLCESPTLLRDAFQRGWRTAIIVDYPAVIDLAEEFAFAQRFDFWRLHTSATLCNELADKVGQRQVTVNGAILVYNS